LKLVYGQNKICFGKGVSEVFETAKVNCIKFYYLLFLVLPFGKSHSLGLFMHFYLLKGVILGDGYSS
jgi:hypothetical protein